jgi:hypothetical protein
MAELANHPRIGGTEEELKRKELDAKTLHEDKVTSYESAAAQADVRRPRARLVNR